uniref:NADH dehydrogenase subunit 6 n=1 Tax=Lingula reevii TaxID=2792136 RepID=UPI002E77A0F7|nr:NADH dehydrogenase subunit 6 [Lingula reevii]WQG15354.1 NADH dehydrogenase subunit 6 [Lingula reevii]
MGFFIASSCLVALEVHPWVGCILFLIYGGVLLVAFLYVLAMDPAPDTRISEMEWKYLWLVPGVMALGCVFLALVWGVKGDTRIIFLESASGYFLPMFYQSKLTMLVIVLVSLGGSMITAIKLVPSHQGAMRPMTGLDFKRMGFKSSDFSQKSLSKKKAKIFWSL